MKIKDILAKMKIGHFLALAALFFLGLIFFTVKSCNLYDENSVLKGKYETYQALAKEHTKLMQAAIAEQEKKIKELEQKQTIYEESIKKKEGQIANLHGTTAELEKKRRELTDKDAIIANLDTQVAAWKEKFSLAQSVIEEKDKIIFNLTEKYDAQVTISNSYKLQFEEGQKLNQIAELRIQSLEKELRISKFTGKIARAGTLILAGLVVYTLVK